MIMLGHTLWVLSCEVYRVWICFIRLVATLINLDAPATQTNNSERRFTLFDLCNILVAILR